MRARAFYLNTDASRLREGSVRLTIVEDDPDLLHSLSLILSCEQGITVAGTYSTAEEALTALDTHDTDIMLVDLALPGMSGIELISRVKSSKPGIEIMVYSAYADRGNLFPALRAGASGYMVKGCTPRELVEAIYELRAGGAPMSPHIARKVIGEFHDVSHDDQSVLSRREREILERIGQGLSYKEIAGTLHLSVHTVHTHVTNIYEKLQSKNRRDALMKARKMGII